MPSIKSLLEELKTMRINPAEVHISAQTYDDILDDAEESAVVEENPGDE